MFCQKCGGKLESYASNCAFCGTPVEKYDTKVNYVKEERKVEGEKPLTAWRWIGFYLLPCIPLIGSIIQIVLIFKWAFGSTQDLTKKGFARAQLLVALFAFILAAALVALVLLKPEWFANIPNLPLK